MTVYLLDANVLIAMTSTDHVHTPRVDAWIAKTDRFAVCPIVQGALVRFLTRMGETPATIKAVLEALANRPGYEFWQDDLDYRSVDLQPLRGHRQVTDRYLAALAGSRANAKLATLDEGLVQSQPGEAHLIPALPHPEE